MVRGRRGVVAAFLVLAGLTSCARADLDDLAASRDEVRAAAVEDIPAFVDAVGGEVLWAHGEYEQYGLKDHIAFAYETDARIEVADLDAARAAEVLDGLGWSVEEAEGASVSATRDGLTASVVLGDGHVRLSIDGPELRLAGGARPAPDESGQQEIGLPYPLFVPYEPPGPRATTAPDARG